MFNELFVSVNSVSHRLPLVCWTNFLNCTSVLWRVYGHFDLTHFGPKTFRHHVFGAEVSQIFVVVPKCPLDTSANGHFGTSAEMSRTLRH